MAATTYPQGDWIGQEFANESLPSTEVVIVPARTTGDNTETVIFRVPVGAQFATVSRVSLFASAAISAVATNLQTLSVRAVHSGTPLAIATGVTPYATSTALAAYAEKNLFTGNLYLKPGDLLTLKDVSSGTGAALPECSVVVEYLSQALSG